MIDRIRALRFWVYPVLVLLIGLLLSEIRLPAAWHWLAMGWALATVSILKQRLAGARAAWPIAVLGHLAAATAVTWAYQWLLRGAAVSLPGAAYLALAVVIPETALLLWQPATAAHAKTQP